MFIDAQQKGLLALEVTKLNEDIGNLNNGIAELEKAIVELKSKDSLNNEIIKLLQEQKVIMEKQKNDLVELVKKVDKQLRREKIKTKIAAGSGLLLTGLAIFLIR